MEIGHSLIAELDQAIKNGSSDKRIATLRRVTDLFLSNAGRYEPEQVELFDDVLVRMRGTSRARLWLSSGNALRRSMVLRLKSSADSPITMKLPSRVRC